MALKKGRARQSCDFCHKRKLRCDRRENRAIGHAACSACSSRDQPCYPPAEYTRASVRTMIQEQAEIDLVSVSGSITPGYNNSTCSHTPSSAQDLTNEAPPDLQLDVTFISNHAAHSSHLDPSFEQLFDLSMTGVSFLDEVFAGGLIDNVWQDRALNQVPDDDNSYQVQPEQLSECSQISRVIGSSAQPSRGPCAKPLSSHADDDTIRAAMCAYFKYQAPVLPIMPEKAFWADYRRKMSSDILVLALACRGIPFLEIGNKWHLQQLIACEFRRAILQAHESSSGSAMSRVDELEAFALMVDFVYEEAYQDPLESRLGRLFLSFDSLVLSTMHIEQERPQNSAERSLADLASVQDRRTMLFWHVFGLDAFHCLDKLRMSRIQGTSTGLRVKLPGNEIQSYLDAILQLATIARIIAGSLNDHRAGRIVLDRERLLGLYELLQSWRSVSRPPHLAWPLNPISDEEINESFDGMYTKLHSFVLAMLELNCYMQIERHWASQGVPERRFTNLAHDIVQRRIELESLEAIQRTFCNEQWHSLVAEIEQRTDHASFIDRYPRLLRDVCAGVHVWLSSKSDVRASNETETGHTDQGAPSSGRALDTHTDRSQVTGSIHELLRSLKVAVASATSHHDTALLLASLN